MTNREQEILNLIKKNPMISQNDLSDALGITRSSVAVHITNLMKKGYIAGKGYIVKEEGYVTVVGGANIDSVGFPNNKFIRKDSNPGKVKLSLGGVGRNIGENLVRLGINTKLISVIGDDIYGQKILEEAQEIGLDMRQSLILKGQATSTYMAILDEKGDMEAAIAYMDIYDKLTPDFIKEKKSIIENSKITVLDTNIPNEIIEYVISSFKRTDFFLDTVSTTKALKVKDNIGAFHTIKPNRIEAEMLTGIKIENDDDLDRCSDCFMQKGVKRVFISLGEEGVYYNDGINKGKVKSPKVKLINATGAGDAFMAALTYCHYNEFDIDYAARFSTAAAIMTLRHEDTINPGLSADNVYKTMEELSLNY